MENSVKATHAEREFFRARGWIYSAETETKFELFELKSPSRSLVHRLDGWCSRFNGGRFPDPITAYVNAEVEGWAS